MISKGASMYRSLFLSLSVISCLYAQLLTSHGTQGPSWRGGIRVERDHKKVTVHETYLEIEEEIEISATNTGYGSPHKDTQEKILVSGSFAIPHNSVISGAVLWDGDKLLKAKLKVLPDAENQYKDTIQADTVGWEHSTSDPMLISLHERNVGDNAAFKDIYLFDLYSLRWGHTKRLRIRYITPLQNVNNTQTLYIPHVFAHAAGENSQKPENAIIEIKGAPGVHSVQLHKEGRIITRPLSETPVSIIEPHKGEIAFSIVRNEFDSTGIIQKTSLDTGELKGEFLHLYSRVPHELYTFAGLRREVVFLWRWENENSLVEWKNQRKEFTKYGATMLQQAYDICSTMVQLLDSKAGVGMYLDRSDDGTDTLFRMAYKSTKEADTLLNYMNYITSSNGYNIMSEISGFEVTSESDGDTLTQQERHELWKDGADEFRIAIDSISTIFSPESAIVKHIVLVTVGKRLTDLNDTYCDSHEKLKDITLSNYGTDSQFPDGYWPGVNMKKIANEHRLRESDVLHGFRVPRRSYANISMELKSSRKKHIFDVYSADSSDQYFDRIYFTGHTPEVWNDTIVWSAQDNDGNILANVIHLPTVVTSPNDTDLIMLWGGSSSSPNSETIHTKSIGALVGFIDENYSLLAMPDDSLSPELKELIENGGDIPNLSEDEIDKNGKDNNPTGISYKNEKAPFSLIPTENGILFRLNTTLYKNSAITIYDIRGRIIHRFSFNDLTGKDEFFWNGQSYDGTSLASGFYFVRFVNGTNSYSLKFMHQN